MSTRPVEIAPSILSADFLRLGAHVSDAIDAGVRRIHVDVMDGHFVPNLSMGPLVVAALPRAPVAENIRVLRGMRGPRQRLTAC